MAAMTRAKITNPAKRNFFLVLLLPDPETLGGIVATEESGDAATAAPHFEQKRAVSSIRGVPQAVQKRAISVRIFDYHPHL
jgi:hypothetical protein